MSIKIGLSAIALCIGMAATAVGPAHAQTPIQTQGPTQAMAQDGPVMFRFRSIPLPDVTGGDFDHFAVDRAHNRLYVTAEKHQSVEMFELDTGKHLASGGGYANPHSMNFVTGSNLLFIADGGDASVRVVEAATLKVVNRIPLRAGPDAALYDPTTRLLYVGNGGREEKTADSTLSVISVDQQKVVAQIAIPTDNIESMAIDHATHRLFMNMRGSKQIGVVDLEQNRLVDRWSAPGMNLNTPMAYDAPGHRLFVVNRKPGRLMVIDSRDGTLLSTVDCVDIADDMTYDAANQRLYITGAEGLSVMARTDTNHFHEVQRTETKGGKTSVYVPELRQFYVVHTQSPLADAALDIFKVEDAR